MKKKINKIFDELFPILRSITGDGYRKSLNILSKHMNFKKLEYKSGKKVFDWVVPKEWVIKDAFINFNGKKIIDYKKNNLHILNYSAPINKKLNLIELNKYLYSIKKYPKLIPYVTSYYKKNIGFCLAEQQRKKLKKGDYQIVVNSKFINGKVVNGFSKIRGKTKKVILLSSYLCHPSLANNELSGPLVLLGLYNKIKKWKKRKFTYYFLINPETIGSICFIHQYKAHLKKYLEAGLVLTCLGGPKNILSYKKTRSGNSSLDKIFMNLNRQNKIKVREFDPTTGSDERQYNSAELNLPVGQISRTLYGSYHQYHNSGDDKNFMKISKIIKSINEIEKILKLNENLKPLKRTIPFCEIQLGKRGLYPNINSFKTWKDSSDTILKKKNQLKILQYLFSYADGKHNILDISNLSGFTINEIEKVLKIAIKRKLIKI